jgi:hypothetical protein
MKNKMIKTGRIRIWFEGLLQSIWKIMKSSLKYFLDLIRPEPSAWTGASIGTAAIVIVFLLILSGLYIGELGVVVTGLMVIFYLLMGLAGALGLFLVLYILQLIPAVYRWVLAGALVILIHWWPGTTQGKIMISLITILSASFIAGPLRVFLIKGWQGNPLRHNIVNLLVFVIGLTGLVYGSVWILSEGVKADIPENAALLSEYRPDHIQLPDPSQKGNYTVLEIYYGSGKDKHRKAFGEHIDIRTDSVDGSRFVSNWEKFHGWARIKYWGFDEKSLPLNARVWYPGGKGPFPLVLIVHGNHMDRDFSDPGYEYLGRLMASRGFIVASVDENFLNSAWSNIFKSLKEENDCRAWLLLKHLELWHKWNRDTINPFYGKVDTGKIALIGHSRGGEAVAIAAAFNQLPYYPDDATVQFEFGFRIVSVIAIAPVDGQYKPAGVGTFFNNVNYFVLQGSHDMDMQSYHGSRQYQRIEFTDDDFHVKAGLYIWGANHGQFNTVWGRNDVGYPGIALYNKKQLIPEEDQKKIASVFISAFLESTLNREYEYLALFRDWRTGLDWLPETIYLNQYEDSNCRYVCSFEEDIDLTTITTETGSVRMDNLTVWKERMTPLKWGSQDTRAVFIGWNLEEMDSLIGSYTISFKPEDDILSGLNEELIFSIAQSKENSNPHPAEGKNTEINDENQRNETGFELSNTLNLDTEEEDGKEKEKKDSIDFTIILKDTNDYSAQLHLSHYAFLQPQLESKIMKADFMTKTAKSEIVFQTFFFPLKDFADENPAFNPKAVDEIRFFFDRTSEGVVVIDDIGFRKRCSE